ncbi:hypothetical protein [Flammeovirga sp. SJP92]|uniref:hypothetical protein n=1 Tax=Flammeovirga sp. SJP92 TaxID=1775430 RepID=UPI0007884343|nr:hypothetical protein [Flammeovirga sp. SJP92]KXX70459.1 hypothetical protein AVL50_08865 [Flammeovirga sp. SJP92]
MQKIKLTVLLYFLSLLLNFAHAEKSIQIDFMTEIQGFKLLELAKDSTNISKLKELGANIYIGLTDFSSERVEALKIFQNNGINCHAWLLLSKGEHYWPNAHNGSAVLKRYEKFREWTLSNQLSWESLTLSLAPYGTDTRIVENGPLSISKVILKRLISGSVQEHGDLNYARLRALSKGDNLKLVSIISPYEVDSREVNVETWKQITGTFNILNDQEVLSIFNSYEPSSSLTLAQLKEYQPGFSTILIGSANKTKPLSNIENDRVLNWDETCKYITLARQYDKSIIIYGLEGAIKNNILDQLSNHLTDVKLPNLQEAEKQIALERENTQILFTILASPGWVAFAFFFIAVTFGIAILRTLKLII